MGVKLLINSLFRGGAEKQLAALGALLPHDELLLLEKEVSLRPPSPPVFLSSHTSRTPAALKTAAIPLYAARLAARTGPGDTVVSFMERANLVNVLAARRSGHRAVLCERTSPSGEFSGLRGALMRPLIRLAYPRAAAIVANSLGVESDLEKNFGVPAGKVLVIRNGCDTAAIAALAAAPLDAAWQKVYSRPVVCTSGRLTQAKGQWHLLRIFRELRTAVPGAALVIAGEGPLLQYLSALAAGLGLKAWSGPGEPPPDADVYFPGFLDNPFPFIARARLFAFTSVWEGFPNSLIEAMACGAPIVSADCDSGPREILAPDTPFYGRTGSPEDAAFGVLMPPLPPQRPAAAEPPLLRETVWAAKLAALLADKAVTEKYSSASLSRASDFELSRILPRWKELLGTFPTT